MKIELRVSKLVEEKIADRDDLFLVDVKMHPDGKLVVLMDGDHGISIQDCAAISRFVGFQLEENNYIETAYNLEVSSPGIDTPLKLVRQYRKNINRTVSIRLANGTVYEGKLITATDEGVTILGAEKTAAKKGLKSRKTEEVEQTIPFNQIAETKVLISFK